jgi:hypothetical protein
MLGGIAERAKRWAHWVPIGARLTPRRLGVAYLSVCGAACVPASADYLAVVQVCPSCDERQRGFIHRPTPECCRTDEDGLVNRRIDAHGRVYDLDSGELLADETADLRRT